MTNLEYKFIKECLSESNFNCESLGLDKPEFDTNRENPEMFETISDAKATKEWAKQLGVTVNQIKGIIGDLVNKGWLVASEDENAEGKPMTWLTVGEKEFNLIKKEWDEYEAKSTKPAKATKAKKTTTKTANTKVINIDFHIYRACADNKKAVMEATKGMKPEEICGFVKSHNVAWEENANTSINVMRAKMALLEAIELHSVVL